ncbi:response regulator [Roseibium sp. MMSF_3544]|uniref:response regulator n=1 Tax=unclassified Roseibium TaxID=2629323 RepID=UPI00273E792D|nr:response regulator transcription factor [Roseibium sp. MMSF_3544]
MPQQILLIEDDARLAEMVQDYLGTSGFNVTVAATGQAGLDLQKQRQFDAILLDLMLPDLDGLEVCRTLRTDDRTPILMLTAKGEPMDRIVGLELGADDYLPKPFEPRELLARLRAILRRGPSEAESRVLRFGRLEIDTSAMEARVDGRICNLTAHQFQLLEIMASRAGRVLSRDTIMNALKGENLAAFDRSIDVHVSRIRAEIEDDPNKPRRLITVRGAGYVFARSQE